MAFGQGSSGLTSNLKRGKKDEGEKKNVLWFRRGPVYCHGIKREELTVAIRLLILEPKFYKRDRNERWIMVVVVCVTKRDVAFPLIHR
jgi:phage terminase large subunit-like protein